MELEFISFTQEDVITTSGGNGGNANAVEGEKVNLWNLSNS